MNMLSKDLNFSYLKSLLVMILFHLGSNDLTNIKQGKLVKLMKRGIIYIAYVFSSKKNVWSDIIQILLCHGVDNAREK